MTVDGKRSSAQMNAGAIRDFLSAQIGRLSSNVLRQIGREQTEETRTQSATDLTLPTSWASAADKLKRSNVKLNEKLLVNIDEGSTTNGSDVACDELEVFKEPMCLVRKEEGNKLKIEDKTVEQINKISCPMVIVAVVGLYRTGKSYLMNRVATSKKGFAVGDTLEAKTKGVWILCNMHPEKPNTVLVLLDTEGLGGIDEGDVNFDNKLFTLATLLCNCLVYNMRGAFDQDAVSKLTFITQISSSIRYRGTSSHEKQDLSCILPRFILCLRDFCLKMVKGGKQITGDEYLEESLKEQKRKDETFNKPRECIRKYFPVRKCFTLPWPGNCDEVENLEEKSFDELPHQFKKACGEFVTYIHSVPPKKLLASKLVTGPMFTILASCYVTAINDGAIPDVDDAFLATAKLENNRIKENALIFFQECMRLVQLPAPSKYLEELNENARLEVLEYLRENIEYDKDRHYELSVQIAMDNIWGQLKDENKEKIRALCDEKLKDAQACTPLKENIENELYHKAPGGHKRFQRDLKQTEAKFMSLLPGYEKHEILLPWIGYSESLRMTESEIIEADEQLSAQEREVERKHYEDQMAKVNEEHTNELKDKDKLLEDERERYKAKMEKVNENYIAELKAKDKLLDDEKEHYKAKMEKVNENYIAELKAKDKLLDDEKERYEAKMEKVNENYKAELKVKDKLLDDERERYEAKMEKVIENYQTELKAKDKLLNDERESYKAKLKEENKKHKAKFEEVCQKQKKQKDSFKKAEEDRKKRWIWKRLYDAVLNR